MVTIAMIQSITTKPPNLIHNSLILLQLRLCGLVVVPNKNWALVKVTVIKIVTASMALSVQREVIMKLFRDLLA